ncbi:hypothetical protein KM043_008345 [Ampulex compressa]|nr:hypothetical protein KM043_008345 [Ampulex compressa]
MIFLHASALPHILRPDKLNARERNPVRRNEVGSERGTAAGSPAVISTLSSCWPRAARYQWRFPSAINNDDFAVIVLDENLSPVPGASTSPWRGWRDSDGGYDSRENGKRGGGKVRMINQAQDSRVGGFEGWGGDRSLGEARKSGEKRERKEDGETGNRVG